MATISFDREIKIPKKNMDKFLDVIEKPVKRHITSYDLASDEKMKEGRELLKRYLSH